MNEVVGNPPARQVIEPDAVLFNEAFLGVLIAVAAANYKERSGGRPMPWLLAFIVVPLVIHEGIRNRLPKTTAARFSKWIASQPLVYAAFAARASASAPYVRRALRYALRSGAIAMHDGGITATIRADAYSKLRTEDAAAAGKQAGFLGRWFAVVEDVPAIFGQLGVTP